MAYLAPIHRPSSVRHALKLNLLDSEEECLVLAKANRVEIWQLSPDGQGLVMLQSKAIYGRVSMLQKIRPIGANTDHLFIGTVRFQYFTVAWNPETRQLDTVQSFVDLTEKYLQGSQSKDRCVVDPTGQYLVLELFQGILNLVRVVKPRKGRTDYLESPEQVRITELKVKASTFLYTENKSPKLAILYDAGKIRPELRLATYRVVDDKMQYSAFDHTRDRENDIGDLDIGASHLIPVPKGAQEQRRYIVRNAATAKAHLGGVIVLGETKLTYLDDESKAIVECALDDPNIWVAWERYDDLNYLLADNYSRLFLLKIEVDGEVVLGMDVKEIGQTTKATVMVNMGNDFLYMASHEGDSQVLHLNITPAESSVEIFQTIPNIAPILDFTVMDLGGRDGEGTNEYSSGQARLVTGSGAWEGGSLRSVRSGVGLEDHAILADMQDVQGVYSLMSEENSQTDVVLISLPVETRILKFDSDGAIEELIDFRSLTLDDHTVLARNLPNSGLLQVTSSAVLLVVGNTLTARWKPPSGHVITAASANDEFLLLSSNGVTLVTLDLTQRLQEHAVQNLQNEEQVACIYVPTQITDIGVVGFWKSGTISVLRLTNLEIIASEDLRRTNDASIPRNITLTQIHPERLSGPTLFVAMEDGIVLTFNVDKSTYALSGRKSIVLGTQQAQFEVLPGIDGLYNVFATCEHPSLIYGSEGRIICSAVTAESATHICSFNTTEYPDSIIVATAEHLKISQIDTERRTHVRSLHIGETVRRIAYSSSERAFGLGCLKRELRDGQEILQSTFRLVEEVNFGEIGKPFVFEPDFKGEEAIECVIRAELYSESDGGGLQERFIVGTTWDALLPTAGDPKGRIHIFGVDQDRSPYLIHTENLKGAVRCLAVMGEGKDTKIVAGLTKTVVLFEYEELSPHAATLLKLATFRTSTCPISLDVTGNIIAIGDMMKSLSLVEYGPVPLPAPKDGVAKKSDGSSSQSSSLPNLGTAALNEIGRHMQSLWTTAVINIQGDSYLVADHDGNLVVLSRNTVGVTLEDRKRLEVTSELNLGEVANKIMPISVQSSPNAMVVPKAFITTSDGSIYLFSMISPTSQDLLMRLQNRMSGIVVTLGNLEFNTYRRFKTDKVEHEEPFRFVDGELVERFLDLDEDVQEEICKGLGPSVEDLRNMIEELKRLH